MTSQNNNNYIKDSFNNSTNCLENNKTEMVVGNNIENPNHIHDPFLNNDTVSMWWGFRPQRNKHY